MALAMRACGTRPVVVLDRPNPLGGVLVEGNVADPAFASFVGLYPLAIRHGMTIGELAGYLNEQHRLGCRLTVVPMRGWRRAMLWEDTGLPWVPPSPNMPTLDTALVYPGGCLIEGTNLSEGRGTTRPFEWIGAPYLDAHRYAAALERLRLPGVRFRPARLQPTFHKWAGRLCDGVQIHVTDANRFKPFTRLAEIAVLAGWRPADSAWRRPPYEFEKRRAGRHPVDRRHPKAIETRQRSSAWQRDSSAEAAACRTCCTSFEDPRRSLDRAATAASRPPRSCCRRP
jgi:uncharacterized protein YbbC (DUF1343 family)